MFICLFESEISELTSFLQWSTTSTTCNRLMAMKMDGQMDGWMDNFYQHWSVNVTIFPEKHPTAISCHRIKAPFPLLSVSWLDFIKVWQLKSSQLKSYFSTEHEVLPNGYGVISSSENDLQGHSSLSNLQKSLKLMHIFKDASQCFWATQNMQCPKPIFNEHVGLICSLQWIDQFNWYLHANYLHAHALHGSVHLNYTDHVGWASN